MNIDNIEMYKDIGLSEIPVDWEVRKINEVALLNPDNLTSQTDDDLLIRYVDIESVSEGKINNYKPFIFKNAPSRARRKVVKGDIIFSTVRPYLKAFAMIKDIYPNVICSTGFAVLRGIEGIVEQKYLYQFISSEIFLRQLLNKMVGSNYPAVNTSEFEKTLIAAPSSLVEQCKVAQILFTIDNSIARTENLIEKYKQLKHGLLQDLLTRGIGEDGNPRPIYEEAPELYQETDIGIIPTNWEVRHLNEIGQVVTGNTPSTNIEKYYGGNSMFISPFDITEEEVYINNTEKTLTYEGLQQTRVIPENSICVVCIGSTIGKIAITTKDCATNQQINSLIPHNKYLYKLYYYLMEFYLKRQLMVEAGLQAVPIVNKSKFEKMVIPIPNDEKEQKVIYDTLTSIDKKIESENLYLNKLDKVKQGLMQDLLTGKVRVNVEGDGDE